MSDEAPPKKRRSQLLVRLPLLIAIGLGIWLWKGGAGLVVAEHQLVFRMPADRGELKRFEYQLQDADGSMLKREELTFTAGAPEDLSSRIQLKEGSYPLKLFRWYGDAQTPQVTAMSVVIAQDEQVAIDVPAR